MKIPLCRPSISNNEIKLVAKSLKSSWLTHGPFNIKFEQLFNKKFKTRYSIAMNSCTSALECAVKSLGVRGEIIIPKMNSIYIKDLIKMISTNIQIKVVGVRPGEKIHEVLYSKDESNEVYEVNNSFKIYPSYKSNQKIVGKKVKKDFEYISSSKKYLNKIAIMKLIKKSRVLD